MSAYSDALDALVREAATALGLPATRDPSLVTGLVAGNAGGCVLVGFPTHAGRLLDGRNLDVPVLLVAPAPSDIRSVNFLLDHMDDLAAFAKVSTLLNAPIDIGNQTYPSVTATARLAL